MSYQAAKRALNENIRLTCPDAMDAPIPLNLSFALHELTESLRHDLARIDEKLNALARAREAEVCLRPRRLGPMAPGTGTSLPVDCDQSQRWKALRMM